MSPRSNFLRTPDGTAEASSDDAKMRRVEAVKPPVSFTDLQRMPDDGNRYELYDGELWVVPAPILLHQIVIGRLHVALVEHVRQHGGAVFAAPLDIVLSEYNVVQPDVVYFGPGSTARLDPLEYIRFPPDAAFEVLSPSTVRNDRGRKRQLMERFGVREYWVLDPRGRSLEVSRLNRGGYGEPLAFFRERCASSVIARFEIELDELFADGLAI
jgi:Uma2 family endonuclease